jgi:hypothetical protein
MLLDPLKNSSVTDGKVHNVNVLDEIVPEAGAFWRLYVLTLSSAFFVVRTKSHVDTAIPDLGFHGVLAGAVGLAISNRFRRQSRLSRCKSTAYINLAKLSPDSSGWERSHHMLAVVLRETEISGCRQASNMRPTMVPQNQV